MLVPAVWFVIYQDDSVMTHFVKSVHSCHSHDRQTGSYCWL